MAVTVITSQWTGFSGGPGWTKLKFDGQLDSSAATAAAGRVRAFWVALQNLIPANTTISISSLAQVLDDQEQLIGEVQLTPAPASVVCTGAGAYSAATGAVVNWLTSSFHAGRHVRGRTFLVPMTGIFQTDGSVSNTAQQTIQTAATALAGGTPGLMVLGHKEQDGTIIEYYRAAVTGASVPDRAAVLRSRRD